MVTWSGVPGVKLIIVGETVKPVGRPEMATLTLELKPVRAVAERANAVEPPPLTEISAGLTSKKKSANEFVPGELPPPPHPSNPRTATKITTSAGRADLLNRGDRHISEIISGVLGTSTSSLLRPRQGYLVSPRSWRSSTRNPKPRNRNPGDKTLSRLSL